MKLENDLITQKYTYIEHEDDIKYNAPHHFKIYSSAPHSREADGPLLLSEINMQEGPVNEIGINGCHNEDLIAIILARLESFQKSEFKCRENACAITKLEEALMWLRKRTSGRENRNVEGTHKI